MAGQEAKNDQKADADAFALQVKPSNENAPVRVLSKGDDGDVSQSNSTTAIAAALNDNDTKQSIDQIQGGGRGHGSDYVQVAGTGLVDPAEGRPDATAIQLGASNENAPVRVGSPSRGGGSVDQSNDVGALAVALNAERRTRPSSGSTSGRRAQPAVSAGRRPGLVDGSAGRGDDPRVPRRDEEEAQPQVSTRSGGRRDTGDHPSYDMH